MGHTVSIQPDVPRRVEERQRGHDVALFAEGEHLREFAEIVREGVPTAPTVDAIFVGPIDAPQTGQVFHLGNDILGETQ